LKKESPMSTRGAIARLNALQPLAFSGRYVHWDCYPTGLGAELWQAYHGHFQNNAQAMLKTLLDDHPAGWSSLCGADFSQLAPAMGDKKVSAASGDAPICYCHGERQEDAHEITERNASGSGCEWVYVFASSLLAMALPATKAQPKGKTLLVNQSDQRKATLQTVTASSAVAAVSPALENGSFGNEPEGSAQTATNRKPARSIASGHHDASGHPIAAPARLLQPALLVLSSFTPHGDKMIGMFGCGDPDASWRLVTVLDLEGAEPDWEQIEEHGRSLPASVLTNFSAGRVTIGRRKPATERHPIGKPPRFRRRFSSS
jgi:hypothetical protein